MATQTLGDLFDVGLLKTMVENGYVRRQIHPHLPLAILNYSGLTQFERIWNPVTRQCRGLIYDIDTELVVARCLPKFHNWGEPEVAHLNPTEAAVVTDKLDGSLGLLYDDGDGGAIATRGSFVSEQALHATAVWKSRYAPTVKLLHPSWTALFEIIYPANRIVCDYQGADDLFLLGMVNKATGTLRRPVQIEGWHGPVAEQFSYATLLDALAAPPREGAEGLVVDLMDRGEHIKIKQSDYVALHRIVTGLSTRTVWEHLAEGRALVDLIEPLPDEFHSWVGQVATDLVGQVHAIRTEVESEHARILTELPEEWNRKDYAMAAKRHRHAAALFRHLDGRDFRDYAWKLVKPEREMAAPGASVHDEAVA